MLRVEELQKKANAAILELREESLAAGHSFMIRDARLPKGQHYFEYPDGSIRIEKLSDNKFVLVKQLTSIQAETVRNNFLYKIS